MVDVDVAEEVKPATYLPFEGGGISGRRDLDGDPLAVLDEPERGAISVCFSGNIIRDLDALNVRKALLGLFQKKKQKGKDRPTGRGGKADRSGNDISLGGVPLPSMGQHTSGPHEDLPVDGDTHKLPAIRDSEVPAVASPAPSGRAETE